MKKITTGPQASPPRGLAASLLAALRAPAPPPKRPPDDLIFEVTYRVAVYMDCWKYGYLPMIVENDLKSPSDPSDVKLFFQFWSSVMCGDFLVKWSDRERSYVRKQLELLLSEICDEMRVMLEVRTSFLVFVLNDLLALCTQKYTYLSTNNVLRF